MKMPLQRPLATAGDNDYFVVEDHSQVLRAELGRYQCFFNLGNRRSRRSSTRAAKNAQELLFKELRGSTLQRE
jgi:hypothetical protein